MIDEKGRVCCDKCGKVHLKDLAGWVEWTCPRCKKVNVVHKNLTESHNYDLVVKEP